MKPPITQEKPKATAAMPRRAMLVVYDCLMFLFKFVLSVFFRQMSERGAWQVPERGPVLFVIAPHANQFVDPLMVLKFSGRRIGFCCAAKTMRRPLLGQFAGALQSIPVERAQDLAVAGTGEVYVEEGDADAAGVVLRGRGTRFTRELAPRAQVRLPGKLGAPQVVRVDNDTTAVVSAAPAAALQALREKPQPFSVVPHVSHETMFAQVNKRLEAGHCVGIFPEGGSHDRTSFLPMKVGAALMAFNALAANPELGLRIVPVGLNYFQPDKFRSRAVVEYGAPVPVRPELLEQYRAGGDDRRRAVAELMELIHASLKALTVTASDYDTLMIIQAARRLYQYRGSRRLTDVETLDLTRKIAMGIERCRGDERVAALTRQVREYNRLLTVYGLRDHQVMDTDVSTARIAQLLLVRLAIVAVAAPCVLPGALAHLPIVLAARHIAAIKAREALAASTVKKQGRDVLASWKILVAAVVGPVLYVMYGAAAAAYCVVQLGMPLFAAARTAALVLAATAVAGLVALALSDHLVPVLQSIRPLVVALPAVSSSAHDPERLRKMRRGLAVAVAELIHQLAPTITDEWENQQTLRSSGSDPQVRNRRPRRAPLDFYGMLNPRRPDGDGPTSPTSPASSDDDDDDCDISRTATRRERRRQRILDYLARSATPGVVSGSALGDSVGSNGDDSGFPLHWSRQETSDVWSQMASEAS